MIKINVDSLKAQIDEIEANALMQKANEFIAEKTISIKDEIENESAGKFIVKIQESKVVIAIEGFSEQLSQKINELVHQ